MNGLKIVPDEEQRMKNWLTLTSNIKANVVGLDIAVYNALNKRKKYSKCQHPEHSSKTCEIEPIHRPLTSCHVDTAKHTPNRIQP